MTATKSDDTIVVTSAGRKVEVSKAALRGAGWIIFDEVESCDHEYGGLDEVATAASEWHDTAHAGVFRFCYEQPCKSLREAMGLR